jgi:hypothetical protein
MRIVVASLVSPLPPSVRVLAWSTSALTTSPFKRQHELTRSLLELVLMPDSAIEIITHVCREFPTIPSALWPVACALRGRPASGATDRCTRCWAGGPRSSPAAAPAASRGKP